MKKKKTPPLRDHLHDTQAGLSQDCLHEVLSLWQSEKTLFG